MSTHRCAGYL